MLVILRFYNFHIATPFVAMATIIIPSASSVIISQRTKTENQVFESNIFSSFDILIAYMKYKNVII